MTRRVFISYQHRDQMTAKGFNLMRYNPHLDLAFTGRHLLDPVKSNDTGYITSKVKEQLKHTSMTVVLIGQDTAGSAWVAREIDWSLEKGNGLVGIRLDPSAEVPAALIDAGAEILDWQEPDDVAEFGDAIERAAAGVRAARNMPSNSVSSCLRA